MSKHILVLIVILAFASCTSQKYAYHFDHYNYHIGEKVGDDEIPTLTESPLTFNAEKLTASTIMASDAAAAEKASPFASIQEKAHQYKDMSRKDRRAFRKELSSKIKDYALEVRSGEKGSNVEATQQLDDELKLAIVFGAVGITLVVLGGINTIFWVLGAVGLAIGLVFFIRWISTQ